jgi:3-hydroxyisobutyrate dehydrogenase-like beta-hydroxyacid dehydrogenase
MTGSAEATRVGFIGLGAMGGPMAANLVQAGHRLTVHDLRAESARSLLDGGATWASSPAEVAAASEVTFLSLPSPSDVEGVVGGDDGVLAGARPGTVVIDLSTGSATVARSLAERAAEAGVAFLDAPVSGGVAGARKGALALMVGGDRDSFDRCHHLFEVLGDRVFHVGDVGAGSVAKLVNNMLFFHGLLATVEAMVLAGKAGVDLGALRDVVQASSGASFVWDYASRAIIADRIAPNFTVALAAKDAALAVDLAAELGVPTPSGAHVRDLLAAHRDAGLATEDVLAIVKALEVEAGTTVRGRSGS